MNKINNFQKLMWYVTDVAKNDLDNNKEIELIRFLTYIIKDVYNGEYKEAEKIYKLIDKMFTELIGPKE